jgi:hypothetical protein
VVGTLLSDRHSEESFFSFFEMKLLLDVGKLSILLPA